MKFVLFGLVVVSVMKFVMLDLELVLYEKLLVKWEKGILLKVILIFIDLDNIDFIYVFEYCGFYLCFFWMLDEISKCIWKISIVLVVSINF